MYVTFKIGSFGRVLGLVGGRGRAVRGVVRRRRGATACHAHRRAARAGRHGRGRRGTRHRRPGTSNGYCISLIDRRNGTFTIMIKMVIVLD